MICTLRGRTKVGGSRAIPLGDPGGQSRENHRGTSRGGGEEAYRSPAQSTYVLVLWVFGGVAQEDVRLSVVLVVVERVIAVVGRHLVCCGERWEGVVVGDGGVGNILACNRRGKMHAMLNF